MGAYDLYEVKFESLLQSKLVLEKLLEFEFEERESTYHSGSYYSYGSIGKENFELRKNLDPFENRPLEDNFPAVRYLLYVNNSTRAEELFKLLSRNPEQIRRLRSESF